MGIPVVYVAYAHRPMCVGLFFNMAFRQIGCSVVSVGPFEGETCYNLPFEPGDTIRPTVDLPEYRHNPQGHVEKPYDIERFIDAVHGAGYKSPDLVVMIDQYDPFHLVGSTGSTKFAYVSVENWGPVYAQRAAMREGADEYYMIYHTLDAETAGIPMAPLPDGAEWLPFGADPFVHACLGKQRLKAVCQIGSQYQPRPAVWDTLRATLDGAAAVGEMGYARGLHESKLTVFGHVGSYREMRDAYNSSVCALSSSNVDFVPMRVPEAFAFGCVLLSDDQPSIRQAFGAPYPENPEGIWVARSSEWNSRQRVAVPQGYLAEMIRDLCRSETSPVAGIRQRALAEVAEKHWYAHRARRILERAGLEGSGRMQWNGTA